MKQVKVNANEKRNKSTRMKNVIITTRTNEKRNNGTS